MLLRLIEKNPLLYINSFDRFFCKDINSNIRSLLWISILYNNNYIEGFKKVDKKLL